jgi:hypothetical protein
MELARTRTQRANFYFTKPIGLFFVQSAGILLSTCVVGKDKSRLWCLRGSRAFAVAWDGIIGGNAARRWNADRRRVQGQEYRRYKEAILR